MAVKPKPSCWLRSSAISGGARWPKPRHPEEYRPHTKNLEKLDKLINYLDNRRAQRHYIGSAHVEKGNDLFVAYRQKHQGMHWSGATSDGLAALRTLLLNGGWDLYWQKHQVLPLAIQTST